MSRSWLQIACDWDGAAAQAEGLARVARTMEPESPRRCFCGALLAMPDSGVAEEQESPRLCASRR